MLDKPATPPKPKELGVNAMHQTADYSRLVYHVEVEPDVSLDDLLRPGFWAHHAGKLKRGDLIDVVSDNFKLDVQLRVISTDIMMVTVRPRLVATIRASDEGAMLDAEIEEEDLPELPEFYNVGHAGNGWWVRNSATTPPVTIASKLDSEADAYAAAIEHHKKANGLE